MNPRTVLASALAGTATGSRTFTGLAAVALSAPDDATTQPDRTFARPAVKAVVALAALQEWVMDKLPVAPSRLEPAGFGARLVCGALCGVALARRAATAPPDPLAPVSPGIPVDSDPDVSTVVACAVAGAASAAGAAYAGHAVRTWGSRAFGRDWPVAALEDLAAAGAAGAAVLTR